MFIDARSSLHPIKSSTAGLEGFVELELREGSRLDLRVPSKGRLSLPVERLRSGNSLEDRELKRRIDARHYPTIDGELGEMHEVGGEGRLRVRGDVTFRGVTRTYEAEMQFRRVDERTVEFIGSSTFDVRDFGMEPPRILMLRVEPDVKVRVEIVAVKED